MLLAVCTWLVFEYLGYQARYQWNDIRGLPDDMRHPSTRQRGRLPTQRWGPKAAVLGSAAVAVCRTAAAVTISLLLPVQYRNPLLIGLAATWVVALAYEAARSSDDARLRAPHARATAIWLVVGGGYAIRTYLGLSLASVPVTRSSLFFVAAAWAFGIVFVTLTWILEAVGHCYSNPRSGSISYPRTNDVEGGPAGYLGVGGTIALSLVVCRAGTPVTRLLAIVVSTVGVLVLAAVTAPAWTLPSTVVVAVFSAVYWFFRNSSYADLRDFDKNVAALRTALLTCWRRILTRSAELVVGKRTLRALAESSSLDDRAAR